MKLSIVQKLAFGSVLLVLFSSFLVGGVFYTKTGDLLLENALESIARDILKEGSKLQAHVIAQNEDVRFLASTPPIQGMLRALKANNFDSQGKSTYRQWDLRLQSIFQSLLAAKPFYNKLRFINRNGQELVVVGREGDKITAVNGSELQNKSGRSYFRETVQLQPGEVYVSEINLNREYGKISIPYQEVVRSAIPVFDEQSGKLSGIVVITAEIGHELRLIQEGFQDEDTSVYITNDQGDYLSHPDPSKIYGFDLGKRYRVQQDIPNVEKLFSSKSNESYVILLPDEYDGANVVNFTKIPFDPSRPERYIAVGVTQLYSHIVGQQAGVMNDVIILAFVFAAVVTLLAILFAVQLSKPVKQITQAMDAYAGQSDSAAEMPPESNDEIGVLVRSYKLLIRQVEEGKASLKKMNQDLEQRVVERTRALESSEIRQRSIIDNMADGLLTIDRNGRILSMNPAAEKIFGYRLDELVGKNINILMPEPYHSEHDGYLKKYIQTGTRKIIGIGREVEGLHKNGTLFPVDLAVSEVRTGDELLFTGIVRDITERKQMEKMKNEFISTVSHELRTPLTSIRGSLGLINGGAVGELPEQAKEMLKIAGNNTERLLLLINDILDIQKIESGQMTFKFQSLELMPFLEQAVTDNAEYGSQHGVKYKIARSVDDSMIYADKDRMMQVMANLLSNAAKFSPENEAVEISVARRDNKFIRISVSDHGPGIPEEFQPKLFEKFTQSDSSDTRQKGGTGLGLNITRAIVEKHGGRIDFVSRKGTGTTFYIDIPEISSHGQLRDNNIPLHSDAGHGHSCILIVEDDPDIAALVRRMLAEDGFDSDVAYDAQEARSCLKENPDKYKAITLDLLLPGEDGISFLQSIRAEAETYDIPVIVVSAQANESKREINGGAVGVVDWLQKPIDQQRLIKAVKQITGTEFPSILHVEDEDDVHRVVSVMLKDYCRLTWTKTLAASQKILDEQVFDLVLLDIGLPDGSGLDLLETIEKCQPPPRVVIFSANDVSEEYAKRVSSVLVKSKTDNLRLTETIKGILAGIKRTQE